MMKISERGRKILRTVFRGIGVSAVSLIIQACYGMPFPDDGMETSIYGKVMSNETGDPILGINVSIEETELWDRTDKNGGFYLLVPTQDEFILKFEDIDGPYNGGLFKEQKFTLKLEDAHSTLMIGMDIDSESTTTP
jgi:hypothetical protein